MHNKRTIRQFNHTSKKIKKYIASGEWLNFSPIQRDKILERLNELIRKIGNINIISNCVKSLVGLGLFVLTSKGAIAQTYQAQVTHPFNLAGKTASFGGYHLIPTTVDIDADGDLDLFHFAFTTYFNENIGTADLANFDTLQTTPFNVASNFFYISCDFGDLDDDGDMDIFFGGSNGTISFQENIGTANVPNFGPIQTMPFGITNVGTWVDLELVDIDNDGDLDLMVAAFDVNETKINLFNNTGTSATPIFSAPITNPFGISPPPQTTVIANDFYLTLNFGDVDCDGDMDLLMGFAHDDILYFQENIAGSVPPNFAPRVQLPFNFKANLVAKDQNLQPELADMDNDGDLDLLVGGEYKNRLFYFEMCCSTNPNSLAVCTCGPYTSPSGKSWNTSGTYSDTIPNAVGGDSLLTIDLKIHPKDTASFSYPKSNYYCLTDQNPTPNITTNTSTGGKFSINNNGRINPYTGEIFLPYNGFGDFTITYITNGVCPDTTTSNVSVFTPSDTINVSNCTSYTSPSGKYTWSTTGTYSDTIPKTPGCDSLFIINLTIPPRDNASFSFQNSIYCLTGPNPTPTNTATPGGIFSINNSGSINPISGELDILNSGIGNFTLTYTTNGTCPDTASSNITINDCPQALYTISDSNICEGECAIFTDQSINTTDWAWTFNGGTPSTNNLQGPHNVCFNSAGTYNIILITSDGNKSDTTNSNIVVNATPTINAGPDVNVVLGKSTTLNTTGTNGTYSWNPPTWLSCITCANPIATSKENISYNVAVVDSNGCTASDEVTVTVNKTPSLTIPNVFSPNGDGSNETFNASGENIETYSMLILNRWGQELFQTNSLKNGWDGKLKSGKTAPPGTYFYIIEYNSTNNKKLTKKGSFTLLR